jgi:hypothetical protein
MVADRTQPPCMCGNGGTSVPPPANEMRSGARARMRGRFPVGEDVRATHLRSERDPHLLPARATRTLSHRATSRRSWRHHSGAATK